MHKLSALLGMPQHRFASIHVVGTNGKSSVTRMTAALLEAHGLSTGACVSPHPVRWSERILIRGFEIGPVEFAAAVERAVQAAEVVNRDLAEGEAVTQFEVATAASFVALASAKVEAAVVEAGLGGRLDATNTIPSRVTALTSIGLDHTQWLGETEEEIAAEKLAVLNDYSTLVLGAVSPAVASLAKRTADERGARLVVAPEDPGAEIRLLAPGRFQRRNFALASAAAEAFLGELDRDRVAEVAAGLAIPGRLERIADDPPTYVDAAHNPDGAAALAEALPEIAAGRPVVACLAMLSEKDHEAVVRSLAPALAHAVCTELPGHPPAGEGPEPADGPKSEMSVRFSATRPGVSAGELARTCEAAGLAAEAEPAFEAAVRLGQELAAERGGILLITGSHYILQPARQTLGLCED
jgi:dihydrofolate synthase/folylpolyglutamate synthase